MTKHDLGKLYLTQKSLTEWLEDIAHENVTDLRQEDNEKRERLRVLNTIIGLPFDRPVQFTALEVADNSPEHQKYIDHHGDELCALRLIPLDQSLPKLRMRGQSVRDVQQWFRDQEVDPDKYRAEYIPHSEDQLWSTIFVIGDNGVFGEIIRGRHSQLTQGLYDDDNRPYTFAFDFTSWQMEPRDDEALQAVERIVSYLKVEPDKHHEVQEALSATFARGYLKGYFETTESREFGLWFIDYGPKMGELVEDMITPQSSASSALVSGQVGSKGQASGEIYIVDPSTEINDFPDGAVLVCEMTTPELVPFMQKAAAIVTDQGGILSHAAIVARELHVPCIVGTQNATKILSNGMKVTVDAQNGTVIADE